MTTQLANDPLARPGGNQKPRWPYRANSSSWQSDGLILWYPFGLPRGDQVRDLSPNTRPAHLDFESNVLLSEWDPGVHFGGPGIHFRGAQNDYVANTSDVGLINGLPEMTIVSWHKADSTGVDDGIFTTRRDENSAAYTNIRYDDSGFFGGANNVIQIAFGDGTDNIVVETSANSQTTDWQHLAVRWEEGDPSPAPEVWLDGEKDTLSYTESVKSQTGNADIIGVGHNGRGNWDGVISEIRIYNKKLNDEQMKQLYAPQTRWDLYEPVVA